MNPPRISAVRVPLEGFVAQIWVETLQRWYTMSGCPIFNTDGEALDWAKDQLAGWPK